MCYSCYLDVRGSVSQMRMLHRFTSKIYPGQAVDEPILVDIFIKSLRTKDVQRHVYLEKPVSLTEAINCAVNFESF